MMHDPRMDSGLRAIPSDVEPGTAEYDASAEHLSRPYHAKQDPRTYEVMTIVMPDGTAVTVDPPAWFMRKMVVARRVRGPRPTRRVHSRPRERPARRSAKAARGSPDDGEPAPSDALTFAVALQEHLRAFARVLESEHRDVGGISRTTYDLLATEVRELRHHVEVFLEGERVAKVVAS